MNDKSDFNVSRREFLKYAGASAAVAAVGGSRAARAQTQPGPGSSASTTRPNVLIIFPDEWRRQAFGCNGDPVVRTPNIDKFAASGMNFDRCYATNPVCTPARAVFQTSRYPHQTGMIHNDLYLLQTESSLGQVFENAGYETGYIGKWHIGGSNRLSFIPPGRRQGYNYFEGFNCGHFYGPNKPQWFTNEGKFIKETHGFESEIQTDMAIKFMRSKALTPGNPVNPGSPPKPFMLFVSWGPPHPPYGPPTGFNLYKPHDLKWRENVPEAFRHNKLRQRELCGYYGLCEALDHQMGRLMKFLDDTGLAKNTVVVFASDHGDSHGSQNLIRKTHPEEESLGVPLMVRYPGVVPSGVRTQTLASTIDFSPTLISLAGLEVPKAMQGRDLSPVLKGKTVSAEFVYCAGRMMADRQEAAGLENEEESGVRMGSDGKEWRALVTDRYKLAVNVTGDVHRLSDLQEDPLEMKNLATDPGAKGVRDELMGKLRDYAKQVGDPFPARCAPAPSVPT